jgi:hypothetical protein
VCCFSELERDIRGTATSLWAVTRILNLFIVIRTIRSMPHFTNYGIIMGTISDGMRNLKAFIGILIVSRSMINKNIQNDFSDFSVSSTVTPCWACGFSVA